MTQAELRRLARIGAGTRLGQLQVEIEDIYRTFPDLRSRKRVATDSTNAATNGGSKPRRRKKMSAAARKAVGARMKKYWAARRAKENKAA
jgi:hypothetical protein